MTPRRGPALLLAIAGSLAILGAGSAFASTGGSPSPGGTITTAPAPAPTTPAPTSSYLFPIQGKHTYGQGFGAARAGGRSHEGQDVMAACGTPLRAVSNSVVRFKGRQSAAGNYLVLHDLASGQDYAYMHLMGPGIVVRGQRLTAGQAIAWVGKTGDATACHLHFEVWLAPGWYRGGKPTNPLPVLQAWDAYS